MPYLQSPRRAVRRVAAASLALLSLGGASAAFAPADAATIPGTDLEYHPIVFPVQEKVTYSNDYGAPRSGGRTHEGNDIIGKKLNHELAVVDGTVTSLKVDGVNGLSGNMLTLKGDDGWFYYYIHINNDTPGTDDGLNPPEYRFAPGIVVGSRVKAGDFIAYMGDSGNAESTVPHLHFEIHRPDGSTINPYYSLRLSQGLATGGLCEVPTIPAGTPSNSSGTGYWLLGHDGGIFTFGAAQFYGSTGGIRLNRPVEGMSATATGKGYWLVADDGGIFSFGDATFYGSTGGIRLNKPIVGMATTPTGKGYWLVATDGGIFTFGDAQFFGSTGAVKLNKPIVGMATTPTGKGYWLTASDGGIFSFGDATFSGSTGAQTLPRPILSMTTAPGGKGYWLMGADGTVYPFGTAQSYGDLSDSGLCVPEAAGLIPSSTGKGYWIAGKDGTVWPFGDAKGFGSLTSAAAAPMIGMTKAG